jgi:hypothetical protein
VSIKREEKKQTEGRKQKITQANERAMSLRHSLKRSLMMVVLLFSLALRKNKEYKKKALFPVQYKQHFITTKSTNGKSRENPPNFLGMSQNHNNRTEKRVTACQGVTRYISSPPPFFF